MEKSDKRKLTIWGIVILAGLVAAIAVDQTNPNKNNREVPDSDMLSKQTKKVMPAKSNIVNWWTAKSMEKPYAG